MMNQDFLIELQSKFQLGAVALYATIPSTNDLAAQWLNNNCPDKSLITAGQQTRGKGRQGRVWHSPPNASLSISLILKSGMAVNNPDLNAGMSAVAVCQAITPFVSSPAQIKWPNDVLIARRKVCGILVESQWEGSEIKGVVVGIGVNMTPKSLEMPEPPRFPATCLQDHASRPVNPEIILSRIVENILLLNEISDKQIIVDQWNIALAFRGETVASEVAGASEVRGKVEGVAPDGSLMLLLPSGKIGRFQPNEIRILPNE